jgi:hypothetical protein
MSSAGTLLRNHALPRGQVLSQESHRHRVKKERTLSGEADNAALWVEL